MGQDALHAVHSSIVHHCVLALLRIGDTNDPQHAQIRDLCYNLRSGLRKLEQGGRDQRGEALTRTGARVKREYFEMVWVVRDYFAAQPTDRLLTSILQGTGGATTPPPPTPQPIHSLIFIPV